jgi:sulfatase maturation enzyme AslB (radical SAM superfamily)
VIRQSRTQSSDSGKDPQCASCGSQGWMTMHELIISPFLDTHLVLRPGQRNAVKISRARYAQLQAAGPAARCPDWLAHAVRKSWGIDVSGRPLRDSAILREPSPLGYGRASYELNMGCNYDCKHCYLGLKEFAGLDWPDRERILTAMRDAGVLWLQLTGGEPTIDKLFVATYTLAFELGMMIEVLTNGSRLSSPAILGLFTSRPPHRVTLSVYGATEASYDALTQRRGSYRSFMKGLSAARDASVPLDLSVVVTTDNAHEVDAMHAMAGRLGIEYRDYRNMSPTIYGGAESLSSQSLPHLNTPQPFTGCDAGHTSFHVDPHGRASICKVGREPSIALAAEGTEGLRRLGDIADQLLRRQGGCTGCTLSAMCGTCMPLAAKYRQAKAPLNRYCQHTERR